MIETIQASDFTERYLTLCVRGGAGRELPHKRRDRWILYRALQARLVSEGPLGEREVTARIQDWLLDAGRDFATDAVTLRRELVDEGFLERDDYGREYRPSRAHERNVRFEEPPADLEERLEERRRGRGRGRG
jgi:hypothetical protein